MNATLRHPAGTPKMRNSLRILALLLAAFAIPSAAFADATYTYTGNSLTTCSGSYAVPGSTTCNGTYSITGSFTLGEVIGADMSGVFLAGGIESGGLPVTAFTYTDNGLITLTNTTHDSEFNAEVWTNDRGEIVRWDILVSDDLGGTGACSDNGCDIETVNNANGFFCSATCTQDFSGIFDPASGFNTNDAGTWTMTSTSPVPTPEPSSLALMLAGIGLVFVTRKRIAARSLPPAD